MSPPSYTVTNRRRPNTSPSNEFGVTFSTFCHPPDYIIELATPFFPPPPSSSAESSVTTTHAITPATETPAPNSPESTNTSASLHLTKPSQDTEESPAPVEQPPTPVIVEEQPQPPIDIAVPPEPVVAPPPKPPPAAKTAPKSWSALFVKPGASTTPKGASSAVASTSVASETAAQSVLLPAHSIESRPRQPTSLSLPKIDPATLLVNPPLSILAYDTPLLHPRGLINFGNVCFANSVLQVLLYCSPFWRIFMQGLAPLFEEVGQMGAGRSQCVLLEAMLSFVREFKLASEVELPKDPLPGEPGYGKSKAKDGGKPKTVEQLRRDSFNQDPFIPEFLYAAMKENKRFDNMQKGHQEDAEEFLGFLLDTLHEELIFVTERLEANPTPALALPSPKTPRRAQRAQNGKPEGEDEEAREVQRPLSPGGSSALNGGSGEGEDGWLEVGKKNKVVATRTTKSRESVITKIFGGKLRSVLKTPGAGKTSATLEPYQPLQLDIQADNIHSIEDALRHITVPETVSVRSAKGVDVAATKQVFIDTLPPILILHIKRFIYDPTAGIIKSQKVVGYGSTLSIPQEVLPPVKRTGPPIRYQLFGVVYHHGKHATGGHYTVDVLRQDQSEWIRIDDTTIDPIKEDDVVTITHEGLKNPKAEGTKINPTTGVPDKVAYLLFYKQLL
ncbi:hypothetical protein FRC01_004822 [Tulasnella sp. 417]|nr:hypothetical protein FRC01_004822 [Tulasnella sp. 417]